MDFTNMSNDALSAALTEAREKAKTLFALDTPTIEQVDEVEALVASIGTIETEQAARATAVKDAEKRLAAAKATFSAEPVEVDEDEEEETEDAEAEDAEDDEAEDADEVGEGEEAVEAATGTFPPRKKKDEDEDDTDDEDKDDETVTASANPVKGQTIKASAAKAVGRRAKRPRVAETKPVTITAAADVPGFSTGSELSDMGQVAKALQARVKGFSPFNKRAAEMANSQSGGAPVLNKFGVASFGVQFDSSLTASGGASAEYDAVKEATKQHVERVNASLGHSGEAAMTAAMSWCAPSPVVYNWIADYVVDGLVTVPEVDAPRGGLMMTEGPQLAQTTYADLDDFGFGGTEAEMEAGYVKTCETILCPEFEDHRLDFSGYCWKIPLLTEKAFPELVADALRLSNVLYAHKMNGRLIKDMIAESTAVDATTALGGSMLDTLEALTQVAVKERRWWNVGENAVMEVKLPQTAREIFKFDMSRRSGLALNDIATDQKIAAHFANHNLAVEYVSDFDERSGAVTPVADWADTIRAIMYPAGTFVKAVEDVINMSAVYDAASLSANEYTGVFFEQGVMTVKRGYRSHVITIPVCVAGMSGANAYFCEVGSL